MKTFIKVLCGLLVALAVGVSLLCIYAWDLAMKEAARAQTAAATAKRWPKRSEAKDEEEEESQVEYIAPTKRYKPVEKIKPLIDVDESLKEVKEVINQNQTTQHEEGN